MEIIPMIRTLCLTIAILFSAATTHAQEKLPPGAKLVKLEAHPAAIELKNPFEYRQVVLTGRLENGDAVDVTRLAKVEAPANVSVSDRGLVRPTADGSGQLKFTLEGQSLALPVAVSG